MHYAHGKFQAILTLSYLPIRIFIMAKSDCAHPDQASYYYYLNWLLELISANKNASKTLAIMKQSQSAFNINFVPK